MPKSHTLLLSNRNQSENLDIALAGSALEQVESAKYLGVFIDKNLNWNKHISYLCKTVNNKLFVLRKLRCILPADALQLIYTACIQPVIDYCDTVWNVCGAGGTRRAQHLQNQAARIITGNFNYVDTRGEELVRNLGWQILSDRRNFHTAILMYKGINGLAPHYICDQITLLSQVNVYSTRSTDTLDVMVPTVKRNVFKKSFEYNGAVVWNSIPDFIRRSKDLISFKVQYRSHYFNNS